MNELDTRRLLAWLANDPAPTPVVDIDRAIATAHRHRQRSRWLVAAAAAAVVALVTLGLVTLLRPEQGRPAPVVKAPSVFVPVRTAPASFDPLRPRLRVGWLPDGYKQGLWNAAVSAEFVDYGSSDGKRGAEVYVIPLKGGFPAWGDLIGKPVSGPDIHGQASQWWQVAKNASQKPQIPLKGAGVLRWEWAPGAYAQVRVHGVDDPEGIAARIARSVRLDQQKPFALPLTVSHPQGMRALRTAGIGPTAHRLIEFGKVFGERPSVLVNLGPVSKGKYVPGPNTTLNGRKARVDGGSGTDFWQIWLDSGQEFSVQCNSANDSPASDAANLAECRRVATSMQPVGTLSAPSTWSTSPVR